MIPQCPDQVANRKRRGRNGGRPVGLDEETYKRRNVVERSFNAFKRWRGLATRYDKLALTYRGGVVLRAITIWLNELCRHALAVGGRVPPYCLAYVDLADGPRILTHAYTDCGSFSDSEHDAEITAPAVGADVVLIGLTRESEPLVRLS